MQGARRVGNLCYGYAMFTGTVLLTSRELVPCASGCRRVCYNAPIIRTNNVICARYVHSSYNAQL